MANNQLALYQELSFGQINEKDIVTIRETIAKDCNESQFKLFMAIAKSIDANPLLGEIYPTVYQGKLTPQYGIDLYIRKAKESEGYRGYDVQLVHDNDTFKMHQERAESGRYYVVIDEHSWGFPRGNVIGGYAFAYREGFEPFSVIMDVEEVEHYKKSAIGMQKTMWTNQFPDMFKKHMSKRAFKAAFGIRFEDGEVDGNMTDSNNVQPYERKDITQEANEAAAEQKQQEPQPEPEQKKEPADDDVAAKMKKARQQMTAKFKELGITEDADKMEYINENCKMKGSKPTLAEMTGLLKIMDMHIEEKKAADDDLLDPLPEE